MSQNRMDMEHLELIFEGSDYDQVLKIFYDNRLVFNGFADDLVTSVNGELQLRLNFLGDKRFLHTLKLSGCFVVLVPVVEGKSAETYLSLSSGVVLAWPLGDLENLWRQLRYDSEELKSLNVAASDELFLIWLISSRYCSLQSLDLRSMSDAVNNNIFAEDPDGSPTTIDIIQDLNKGEIRLSTIECISSLYDNAVTAYVDNTDNSVIEWKSISLDRKYCLIGTDLIVFIIKQ